MQTVKVRITKIFIKLLLSKYNLNFRLKARTASLLRTEKQANCQRLYPNCQWRVVLVTIRQWRYGIGLWNHSFTLLPVSTCRLDFSSMFPNPISHFMFNIRFQDWVIPWLQWYLWSYSLQDLLFQWSWNSSLTDSGTKLHLLGPVLLVSVSSFSDIL